MQQLDFGGGWLREGNVRFFPTKLYNLLAESIITGEAVQMGVRELQGAGWRSFYVEKIPWDRSPYCETKH